VANNQTKYGNNRNLWRRVYPIGSPRRAPQTVNLVDPDTNLSYSLDLQTTTRHRDYFQIIQFVSATLDEPPVVVYGEYDEGLIYFDNTDNEIYSFNFTFSSMPFVVYTMEESDPLNPNSEFMNVFGTGKDTSGGVAAVSAPFSGTVRYRAAYNATYPATFTSSFTASMVASAGAVDVLNLTAYTASFGALTGAPTLFLSTPINTSGSGQPDVGLDPTEATFTTSTVAGEISAPYSGAIDFIAFQ